MLVAMMGGRALTATELALGANIAPSTASSHLNRLLEAGLLTVERQGRHRYFRLSGPDVAEVLEGLMGLAARVERTSTRTGPREPGLREARVCYDHLAGERGVQMLVSLRERCLVVEQGSSLLLSEEGRAWCAGFGIELDAQPRGRRPMCRPCLDWSERRSHLGGTLGAALLAVLLRQGWAERTVGTRAVHFGTRGAAAFARAFPVRRCL